jgi:hypothetical protein
LATVLATNVPKTYATVVTIEEIQAEVAGGDEAVVKFKSHLKLKLPLFEPVAFDAVAEATGSDISLFKQVAEAAQGLESPTKEELDEEIKKATTKPVFIHVTAPIGTAVDWYGSFKEKKVVDKWISSDFVTAVEPAFKGQPREAFGVDAIEDSKAKNWFADIKLLQAEVLQKIENSNKIAQKDKELQEVRAEVQVEREAKEKLLAASEKQARQLPVSLSLRRSRFGRSLVLVIQSMQSMSVHLVVTRGVERFERDYQLTANVPFPIGHMEGWGFFRGDAIRLTNVAYNPKVAVVP